MQNLLIDQVTCFPLMIKDSRVYTTVILIRLMGVGGLLNRHCKLFKFLD